MAITRRQFVTRLGSLAAAMGISQVHLAKVVEAFGHVDVDGKPKVIWVHGAECTGCSTSLLGLFEDATGTAIIDPEVSGAGTTTIGALNLLVDGDVPRTLYGAGACFDSVANSAAGTVVNIADVLIDFIDLQYHETVMGMGGDLAYNWLADNMYNGSAAPFVLVVEGAVQKSFGAESGGYWDASGVAGTATPWCSIGMDADEASYPGTTNHGELAFDDVIESLASQANCAAVISIGQCATYGGYPGCVSPVLGESQTPAYGVYEFLASHSSLAPAAAAEAAGKVINVPGCPANPWWFVLTVVLWMVDFYNKDAVSGDGVLGILDSTNAIKGDYVDYGRRLKHVFGTAIHGPACPRYKKFTGGIFASRPGEDGCLLKIGCKGISTNALCSLHGWNGQQPENDPAWDSGVGTAAGTNRGGFCVSAGSPCMGCSEKGYPDAYVPFVKL